MKKILFKINEFPQLSETFVIDQIIIAIKSGFDVTILVNNFLDKNIVNQKNLFNTHNLVEKTEVINFKIPVNKKLRLLKAIFLFFLNLKYFKKIILFLKEKNKIELSHIYHFNFYKKYIDFDIIHIQFGNNHQPFEILKKIKLFKSKLIVSFHGHDAFFPIYGFLTEGYYNNLFKYADLIVANTDYLANQIYSIGCPIEKLKTIPIGVDTTFFKPLKKISQNLKTINLVTLGRLDKVKGQHLAIEVLCVLRNRGYNNLNLTIIGEGVERKNLERLVIDEDLQDYVNLVGSKNHEEIRELFNASDIFIFTSIAVESERRETQGLATLEAQACGLPVVVFDSGGVKYTVEADVSGFIVDEYDVYAMAEKIELLIKSTNLRYQMRLGAIKFVQQNFSQSLIQTYWDEVYNHLIETNDE